MKIISIEPTPSPHSMKINLSESLPDGQNRNYKNDDSLQGAPSYIRALFQIEGVKSIYHVADFIALDRNPRTPWEAILPEVRKVFGSYEDTKVEKNKVEDHVINDHFGEVKVFIQMFRGIPMQVKLNDGNEEKRVALPEMFMNAAMKASVASTNIVMERKWIEQNPRYGSTEEIENEIVEELIASYDEDRIQQLVEQALQDKPSTTNQQPNKIATLETLNNPDWKVRYAALERMDPSFEDLPVLAKALDDEKTSIRRLATAYFGMIEEPEVLPYLYKALKDNVVTVRRTAGDCISDLGFKEAMPEMIASLKDPSRLVRWRAAMFLYELGDESALPALEEALDDPEFEVRMQVKMALQRIEGGEEAKGSVWHQMTQATKQKEQD
ncbi:hypothetical protein HNQ94_001965 [Salirhabdus euzebyi]|uniref:Scaffold protein Nfu/NifU N-terminal domain-containing protein n=1 Tax=Salirhabdus euzebyi TaxID=394506 RepID=A0A841Q532_9BACI|nr:conserved virulence factor C family protein [Salirhabdus euzebyi]MBB6453516.1 hypothetical protein [Salirhabdus euzebyi]